MFLSLQKLAETDFGSTLICRPRLFERFHDPGHGEGGLGGFEAAIVFGVQTALAGLVLIFEEEDLVDDGDFELDLNAHERLAHGFANMLGVGGGTTENDP